MHALTWIVGNSTSSPDSLGALARNGGSGRPIGLESEEKEIERQRQRQRQRKEHKRTKTQGIVCSSIVGGENKLLDERGNRRVECWLVIVLP